MRNGVSVTDLQSLRIDDACALLDEIQEAAKAESKELRQFLGSPSGKNVTVAVDPFQVGKLY